MKSAEVLLTEISTKLQRVTGPDKQGWFTALCPFHADKNHPNLRFNTHGFRCMACGAKGNLNDLAGKLGIESRITERKPRTITDTYDYRDETGSLLFQVVRYNPKSFAQRRPDGNSGWLWSLNGTRRVLFSLPELLASPSDELTFITEGEKDAKALQGLGFIASCNAGGAGKFTIELCEPLKNRHVVVIADKDESGRRHAQQVARLLKGFAASVKVLELPGDHIKDAADWVMAGGNRLELEELVRNCPEWQPPNGTELLNNLAKFVKRFVVLSDPQADVIVLWIIHTYIFEVSDATPYLNITSAEKRSGKTRLLEVLELLVIRPWLTGRVTAAVLARKVDAECPTLLLDESDAAFKGDKEYSEVLRSLLNSGYRRGGKTSICVGQGARIGYKDLATFCPKAIAGIGKLPDTVADRSIRIELKRRIQSEPVERFRRRLVEPEAEELRNRITAWVASNRFDIRDTDIPTCLDDRAADCWEPLLVIADVAGSEWPDRIRNDAASLADKENRQDESLGIRLLEDIHSVIVEAIEVISSADLVSALVKLEEAPWGDMYGKPMDARRLAALLKPYGIRPQTVRIDDRTPKGYRREDFEDAWKRYIPVISGPLSATSATPRSAQAQKENKFIRNIRRGPTPDVADCSQAQLRLNVADVADKTGDKDSSSLDEVYQKVWGIR